MRKLFFHTLFLLLAFASQSEASTLYCTDLEKPGIPLIKIEIFGPNVIVREVFQSSLTGLSNDGKALSMISSASPNVFKFVLGNKYTVDNILIVTVEPDHTKATFESLDHDDWSGRSTELICN